MMIHNAAEHEKVAIALKRKEPIKEEKRMDFHRTQISKNPEDNRENEVKENEIKENEIKENDEGMPSPPITEKQEIEQLDDSNNSIL